MLSSLSSESGSPVMGGLVIERVGIRGMELYVPKLYVEQSELEKYDGVTEGKYTRGLGQQQMGFCADHEDIASICLTVLRKLIKNYSLSTNDIGFLSVGTETLTDKSKSVKTVLMSLFEDNFDVEGVDVKNACFGGTQALFHAVDWIYANWETERRYAVVVMADIAVYSAGPARCTGGVGAFAALIGPNAMLYFDRGLRATHIENVWDFYKPNQPTASEYPVVDGPLSLQSYFRCVDQAYKLYCKKSQDLDYGGADLSRFDALFFHCPFSRLVQKAVGQLAYQDYRNGHVSHLNKRDELQLESFAQLCREERYTNRNFVEMTISLSENLWKTKVEPFLLFNHRVGNMYTASLYSQLVAFFHREEVLDCQRLLFFSYGSGAAAAMFSARISLRENGEEKQFELIKQSCDAAAALLDQRLSINPMRYSEIMVMREKLTTSPAPYKPEAVRGDLKDEFSLFPETYYLSMIDKNYKRFYMLNQKSES